MGARRADSRRRQRAAHGIADTPELSAVCLRHHSHVGHPPAGGRGTDNGLLALARPPASAAGKSAKSISVGPGTWLAVQQTQALLNAPDITTTEDLPARAIIAPCCSAVRWRGQAVAAPADGRASGGFTPEATAAARRASTLKLLV